MDFEILRRQALHKTLVLTLIWGLNVCNSVYLFSLHSEPSLLVKNLKSKTVFSRWNEPL